MKPSAALIEAYEKGKELQNKTWEEIVYQEMLPQHYFLDDTFKLFFDAGYYDLPMPQWVRGWRYGKIPPSGRSTNYRDGYAEAGVSVMEIITDDGEKLQTQDKVSAMFFTGEIIEVEGWLHYRRGADGEPLLVGCREIKKD